jgi:hypothetical protein
VGVGTVQSLVKELLNGIDVPNYKTNLVTYITPPNPGVLPGPAAYVWATSGTNHRQTIPRGSGFRETIWSVSIWLMAPGLAADPLADVKFAGLIDAVVEVLVTAKMPLKEVDPISGNVIQLLSIGEEFTIQQSPVHALSDQRLLMYEALIDLTVKEASTP